MAVAVTDANLPIGVFDSGVGGLTVLAALRRHLPGYAVRGARVADLLVDVRPGGFGHR